MTVNRSESYRYWLLVKPDVAHPTGGIKQLHRLAEALGKLDREATLIQDKAEFHPGWFESRVNTISETNWLKQTDLSPERDIVVMPETYNGEFLTFAPELPKIIFNQNTAYSFGPPEAKNMHRPAGLIDIYQSQRIRHIICVSEHDKSLISEGFQAGNNRVSIIKNAIETELFKPGKTKKRQLCYFPRKNSKDSMIVLELLKRCDWFHGWSIIPIHKRPQEEVIKIMRNSILLLSFGHPEGFGLPVAEAMASGCSVIGYSGLGGRELFKIGKAFGTTQEIAVGDYLQFVLATKTLDNAINQNQKQLTKQLLAASEEIRKRYNKQTMLDSVKEALTKIEA
ncbi:glycosyltransferase [Synechococcus sp. MU1611]|uniref:glycosyltransferase n=1 Tax=Synechococcus sp. MU1611 TaxID=2508345 RepID=UPI001CF87C5E|nr:glycosyltransferase [Synechococcus sp. MU1611]MCB4411511.1 glycosyltransferase family 4 protein [Synechococcus sp. MU1611]